MNRIDRLYMEMIHYYQGDPKHIQHFVKVHDLSRLIGQSEGLDEDTMYVLEAAALVHDIGIKVGMEKYGRSDGKTQEAEGPAAAREMLTALGFQERVIRRVEYLVGHHHTYKDIDGLDYQILVEADFLVNYFEDGLDKEHIKKSAEKIFKTETGKKIVKDMFFMEIILKNGGLVAFPTETVYGLGGNALDPKASMKIYAAKGRPSDNPLIVHIADIRDLDKIVTEVPEKARILAEKYWPGPLTMILPKADIVPKETTGGLDSVAVRFPSDRIAQELILAAGGYVAAPSANTSGRPSPTTAGHVVEDLGNAIDMIIDGGQVNIGLESTIVDFTEDIPVVLRPGYISLEMLRETLGDVRMDKGLIKPDSKVHPKAPGMKYRHYAPKADLAIVEGSTEGVIAEIEKRAGEAEEKGLTVGIIATDETKGRYSHGIVKSIGSREQEETIAHHLYEVLRDFDSCNVSAIYSEAFFTPRMGQAIMNRLLKAAGHKIINVEEEKENDSTGM